MLAVAGRGREGEAEDLLLWRPAAVPRAGVDSEKLEVWNSRSSWRSVWPRSPCFFGRVRTRIYIWGGGWRGTDFVVDVYDGVVA